ncbi:Ubiquitin-like domain-containing protein [Entamoeba marina]
MQGNQVIIRDARNNTQKIIKVTETTTIDSIIKQYGSTTNISLFYQNIVLDRKRTLMFYNIPNNALLYVCPIQQQNPFHFNLPEFAQLSQTGDLLIPFIESLINQNADVEFTNSSMTNAPVFRVSVRRHHSNQNAPHSHHIQIQTGAFRPQQRNRQQPQQRSQPQQQSQQRSQQPQQQPQQRNQQPQQHIQSHQQYNYPSRTQLENTLNNESFRRIIERSQNERYEPNYESTYNASMLYTQSWLNVVSTNLSRVVLLFNSIQNLLNNPRIVLSQQSFQLLINLMNQVGQFMNQTTNLLQADFNRHNNQSAHRVRTVDVHHSSIEQEPVSTEEDMLWSAFEETMRELTNERDQILLQNALEEISSSPSFSIISNEETYQLNEDMEMEDLNAVISMISSNDHTNH